MWITASNELRGGGRGVQGPTVYEGKLMVPHAFTASVACFLLVFSRESALARFHHRREKGGLFERGTNLSAGSHVPGMCYSILKVNRAKRRSCDRS